MTTKKIKLATVFSGIGAIEQALLRLNIPHEIVFACDNGERKLKISQEELDERLKGVERDGVEQIIREEYNKSGENLMEKSYKANYKIGENAFFQDIRYLDGTQFYNQVDLLVGGSPCQAFSCNGKRGGFDDTRGTLFYEYARLIKQTQPKCFIFENVRGMLNHDKGRTWETIKNVFNELNYDIHIQTKNGKEQPILNASDYGIPQLRMRLYVVGIRKDLKLNEQFSFPEPIPLETTIHDYLDNDVPAKYYLAQKGFEFVTTHPSRAQVGIPVMTCQKANQQFNWNGTFIFEPLDKNKHTSEILQRAYIGEWNNQTGVIRMFTPRECLRLMGFPDSFKIVVNDNMMWRQSGNSIVVNVLERIVEQIFKTGIYNLQ